MRQIKLSGGPPWGFRIYGDAFVGVPFRVSKVEEDSVSWRQGLSEGEWVLAIDGVDCTRLTTTQARHLLRNCQGQMCLTTVPREEGPPIPTNSSANFQSPNRCSPNLLPYKNDLSVGDQQDSGSISSSSNGIDRAAIDSRSVRKFDPPSCSRVQQLQSSIGTCESSAALSQDTSSKFGFKRERHNGLFLKQLDQIYANSVSDNSNIKSKHSNVPEREESQRPPTSASDWSETSHPPVSSTSEIDGSRLSASVTPEISVLTVDSVSPDSWPVRELNSVSPVYPDLVERVPSRGGRVEGGGSNKPCVTPDLIEQAPPGEGREGSSKHCVTPESVEPAATGGAANKPCNFSPLSVSEADSTQLEQFEMLVKNLTAETGLSMMTSPTSTDRPNTSNSDDRRSPASPYFRGTPSPGPYLPQPYISSHSSPNGCDIWRSSHSVTSSGHPRSRAQIGVSKDQPDSETPPPITAQVWAPAGSPQIERKQFRPVRFDSHSLTRENKAGSRRLNSAPLTKYQPLSVSADRLASFTSNRLTSLSGSTDSVTRFEGASSRLPRTQDTTVTLLQQARNARNSGVGGDRARVLPVAQVDGVGPTTSTGMPVALRSTVKSESKSDWYKKVYENLHKQPEDKYDQAPSEEDTNYSRSSLRELQRYRGQPGRIENYLPGKSSITSDQNSTNKKASSKSDSFTKAILSEDKLDSYVYNRNEATTLTPGEKKNYYSHIQRGGDIPACGLQKPAPERTKMSPSRYQESNVNIHYRSPVRWEEKEPLSEVELNRRQAETMRRIYRETEARKQQKMVEDRLSRRHGDNLLPSQKSPIPLNRYDAVAGDDVDSVMGGSTPLFATVMHDFQAQSGRELGVSQGDTVRIRRQVDDNWYEAQRGTRVGIIPCSYVQINDPKRRPANREQLERVRARYDFKAQTKKELNLFKGDVVTVLRRIDENWLEGRSTEKIGIFPSSYVQPLENDVLDFTPSKVVTKPVGSPAAHGLIRAPDIGGSTGKNSPTVIEGSTSSTIAMNGNHLDEPAIKQLSPHLTYRAMYPYMKKNDDEMELREGDIITVVEQCADGWYVGTNQRSGVFGTFPGNFTHRL